MLCCLRRPLRTKHTRAKSAKRLREHAEKKPNKINKSCEYQRTHTELNVQQEAGMESTPCAAALTCRPIKLIYVRVLRLRRDLCRPGVWQRARMAAYVEGRVEQKPNVGFNE